jgi:type IV secretion system protein VirD4
MMKPLNTLLMVVMYCLFSVLASTVIIVLFSDSSIIQHPLIIVKYYTNISKTYPITVYPMIFFAVIATINILMIVYKKQSEYGDAQFATNHEINNMHDGMFASSGTILGMKDGRFIRTNASLSTLIVAPQGTGKTAAVIMPTLLSNVCSMIINDIKGELWDKTSLQRSYFGEVAIFAPSKNIAGSVSWNPFDKSCLPPDFNAQIDFVDRIASILYPTEQDGLDAVSKHFNAEARSIFNFFALYLIYKNGETSLPEVFEVSLETDDVQSCIAITLEEEGEKLPLSLRQNGNRILQKQGQEFGASLTTFTQALEPFSRPNIARHLRKCDFNQKSFRQDKPYSLYLYIPANDVSRMAPLVRMLIEYLVSEFLSENDAAVIKNQHVLFAMDEFPRMGYMKALKEAPALQRSYNMSSILVAQDKNQLETTYGRGSFDQFMTTTDYKTIFRQNEDTTAARFSNAVGKTTRKKKSISNKDLELLGSSSVNSEGVPLILPQDFLNLKKNDIYILVSGHYERPIAAKCAWYFKDKNMVKLIGAYNNLTVAELDSANSYFDDSQDNEDNADNGETERHQTADTEDLDNEQNEQDKDDDLGF